MNTPICDFVRSYNESATVRMHMPGHKGMCDPLDITEIRGADELYTSHGIIRKSENNAAALFGSARTIYSCEGSSLCIRAMLHLASLYVREQGGNTRVLAGRNAHKAFMYASALLDLDVSWLEGSTEEGLLSCTVDPAVLDQQLHKTQAFIVYITSPDYAGHMTPISEIADVCHRHGALLLVDNAHGAYLKFLSRSLHPMDNGADMCCDSAHKTLPVLTGGAYLHIGKDAPACLSEWAEDSFALFASTSPSYLIMQSLDRANALLSDDGYQKDLKHTIDMIAQISSKLTAIGFTREGDEPMKLTLGTLSYGHTGIEVANHLRSQGIECEYSDPERTVLMPTPSNMPQDLECVMNALIKLRRRDPITVQAPVKPTAVRVCSIREAMLSPRVKCSLHDALDAILADACVSCPPCVPILMPGEKVTQESIQCFEYYGIDTLTVMK